MSVTSYGRKQGLQDVIEVVLMISSGGKKKTLKMVYPGDHLLDGFKEEVEQWLDPRRAIMNAYGVSLELVSFASWALPSNEEIQRLASAAEIAPFKEFGPGLSELAFEQYRAGNIATAAGTFKLMLGDRERAADRSNLAYCLTLLGQLEEAATCYEQGIMSQSVLPFWQHNCGVIAFLQGDIERGVRLLREVLDWIAKQGAEYDPKDAVCMMILNRMART